MTDEVQQEDLPILNTLKLDHWLIALGESLTACSTFCDGELHRQAVERTLKLAVEGRVMGYRLPTEGLLRDMWRSFRKRELGFLGDDKYDLAIALTDAHVKMDANDLPDGLVLRSVGENALVFLESERGAFSGAEAAEIHSVIMLLRRILYAYAEEDTTQ